MATNNSIYCPECRQRTSLNSRGSFQKNPFIYEIAECNGCDRLFLVKRFNNQIVEIHPHSLSKIVDSKTPEFLKKDIEEAYSCFSVNAWRGTGVLSRRALQKCCIEKGAPDKKLQEQIDWLLGQQIITKDLKEWADEVRLTGNDAAHPPKDISNDTEITRDDAEDILLLLEKFIDVLYIAPALAQERRQKRNTP